jgi:aminoglycoside phosphotransferase family enzyme
MDLAQLIEGLSKAAAYPHEVDTVEVHHSHISVVFLSGPLRL